MKVFQVKENHPQQNTHPPHNDRQRTPKKNIILAIEHVFVWRIVYKQGVVSMNIRISEKTNVKVLVENWFVMFI
jgi:hypothetical protein